jgi:hypothetical protein
MGWESIDSQDFRGFLYKYRSYPQNFGGLGVLFDQYRRHRSIFHVHPFRHNLRWQMQ